MNTNTKTHRLIAVILALCLISPGVALGGGKSGKKNFNEGQKYEQAQQWDMAAQQYALAVAAEPNNPEYKLHYLRALQQASLMLIKRGDTLAEQNDYAGAYTAFRQAYNYDQGNEIARLKMERMLELQKVQASGSDPISSNKIGNVMPTSNEIQIQGKPRSRDVVQTINYKESKFKTVVANLGKMLGLNVVFDESVKDVPVTIDLTDVTLPKALDIIFKTYKFSFEQVDRRTILVYQDNPTNRPRFETLMVKTFYLGNITATQARTALQALLPPGRQLASLDQGNQQGGNLLIVKATATELQLIQDILDSLDKNKNEVVVDVEIYEVSHDSTLEIGNQIVTKPLDVSETRLDSSNRPIQYPLGSTGSLSNLGGIGRANAGVIVGNTFSPLLGGVGTLIGLPPTQLSLLQSKGDSKLLYRTQIHALDGQKNTTKVGKSVPVRLGTTYGYGGGVGTGLGGGINQGGGVGGVGGAIGAGLGAVGGFGYPGIDSIQYRDVGLVIEAEPSITNEGYVEIKMKFETSDVAASGSSADLTPTFTQRSLQTTARIQDGTTSVVAGINQETKGNARAGIPYISMVPILGRFISTPRQTNSQSDIIITVTPHIIRSQGINKDDHLAKYAGQQTSGPAPSVEDVVFRAQQEEEQERRLIAQQIPQPQSVPLNPPAQVATTNAGFNQTSPAPRTNTQPPIQSTVQPVSNTGNPRQPRVLNDQTLVPMANASNNSTASPATSYPSAPTPQEQQPQIELRNNPGAETNGAGENPNATTPKEGEQPDLSTLVTQPAQPVAPATVVSSPRPEHVERALAKMRAEAAAARAAEEEKNKKKPAAPVEPPKEFWAAQNPQQKVSQAVPKMAEQPSRAASTLSLSPIVKPQLGKNFTVAVEVNGQSQMTGASISLKFDAAKLQFKSVRDGGMLGAQPDLKYEVENGNLTITVRQAQASPVKATGRLILVEFAAIAEGQSEIAFNNSGTMLRMPGNANSPATGVPTRITVSRDSVSNVPTQR